MKTEAAESLADVRGSVKPPGRTDSTHAVGLLHGTKLLFVRGALYQHGVQERYVGRDRNNGFLSPRWRDICGAAVIGVIFIAAFSVFLSISW